MNKAFLLFAFTILFVTILPDRANAQWYSSYGVTNLNELTEPQLKMAMIKAEKISGAGGACTIIGGLLAIIGGIVYSTGLNAMITGNYNQLNSNYGKTMTGVALLYGGGGLVGIGIPLWIVGAMRKADVEIALAKFPAKISLQPNFSRTMNDYAIGFTLAITF